MTSDAQLEAFVPEPFRFLADPARDLPRLAKDPSAMTLIESAVARVPTRHHLVLGDARRADLHAESVHLVLTSPPYWTLKEYRRTDGQLGWIGDYDDFLDQLDAVWRACYQALVPGGRLICVVGDVCLSRRKNSGRHKVVPLHASIQERCRALGFDNLAPIIWYKIANATHEVERGTAGFLGKPYEPNAVVKNDIEFILMQRKAGGYRRPSLAARTLSLLSEASGASRPNLRTRTWVWGPQSLTNHSPRTRTFSHGTALASGRCSARCGPTSPAHRRGNIPRPIRSRWPTGLFACSASSAIPFSIPSWALLPRTSPRRPAVEAASASRLIRRTLSRQSSVCIRKPATCSTSRISVPARSPRLDSQRVLGTPHVWPPRFDPRHDLDSGRHRRRGLRHLPTIASRSWRAAACRG